MKAFRIASQLAIEKIRELSVSLEGKPDEEKRSLLKKCAMTTLNSKLVRPLFLALCLVTHVASVRLHDSSLKRTSRVLDTARPALRCHACSQY
jgi:chaperonin GroEL (HSP60 family)